MLALLGVPVPSDLDGRVPVEALQSDFAHSIGGQSKKAAESQTEGDVSEEDRQILLRQMQKLGYMD